MSCAATAGRSAPWPREFGLNRRTVKREVEAEGPRRYPQAPASGVAASIAGSGMLGRVVT
jgi:hypothetical protein